MLWRYIKAQVMVLLCGGLVGPIFLGVYFAMGRSELIAWMFWAGLLITVVDVLVALALASWNAQRAAKTQALEAGGVLALAQITGIHDTNTRINEQPLVKLDLQISGPGLTPFASQDRVVASIGRLPMITNRKLAVLVDPATNEYQIDWDRSSLIGGLMPATFTVAEDNRTYDLTGQAAPLMEILQILKAHNIGMNNMIDLRSNPAARQQVQDIVRRAASQAPAAAPPHTPATMSAAPTPSASASPAAAMAPPQQSTAARLQELETLRAMGSISEDEYAAKRQAIIADL
ncbi:SHOCT domain-containing protein [Mycobacterium sp. NPDC050041]|uniref:SHOCT domain-containing protein n=1 Tax=Mycobacterium sp. NPDC050041 TaxID=3364293 RepID=UPI003C2B5E72